MPIIKTPARVAEYCAEAAKGPWLALDTEFNRTTTYWADLCLIQVNSPVAGIHAIDPLAMPVAALQPFWDLLANQKLQKIVHAGRQDIEIFMVLAGVTPRPLFDTQAAAAALGHGDQAGYDRLVKAVTGKGIDKTSRFTDWSRRPLRDAQLEYALDDVRYLPALYEAFGQELARLGRESWIREDLDILQDPLTYRPQPDEAWRRLKIRGGSPAFQGRLKVLAAWREEEAERRNHNRTRVMRDEVVLKLAAEPPGSAADLARFPGVGKPAQEQSSILFDRLATAEPLRSAPPPPWASHPLPALELLRLLLRIRCQQERVAERLVASGDDLARLAYEGDNADIPALRDWRREIFGEPALALMQGKLSLRYDPRQRQILIA